MKIEILAHTHIREFLLADEYGYDQWGTGVNRLPVTDADVLGEAAGRICYHSWGRQRPATATNAGYLANILDHGHYSVLEHASVTFLVRGVSRSLLAELTRHRHLSFSVVSQRYVDHGDTAPVVPPALSDSLYGKCTLEDAYKAALEAYGALVRDLTEKGLSRKAAREAARAVLPNAAPVDMIVTGNLRAWRDVLGKRHSEHADAEIQGFAREVLALLKEIAPNSFQDFKGE
ncbi:FAD-dependent thymidylate synthase [Streptomyces sp. WI03-4A]|uniref:FAD-dependent thymidylate synthase n=1 Tax=Streptomyces sp. WI03-4A TaxID=3028706 RepID=UPI0029BB7EDA|nr:FAD-dependent thymidylate synthase [Streptomyces sp. WI03-4A]MDX2590963.1 FAD-dependent thymidylate synthase [Streptomyces sp. WI03-4A]